MAEAKELRKVVGFVVELTMEEAIALTNTAERVGNIIDANGDPSTYVHNVDWESLCSEFLDIQGRSESEAFFKISRAVGKCMRAEGF